MMQFLSRFALTRRGKFAAQASAMALGSIIVLPETRPAHAAPPEVGTWVDHDGKGAIEITQCGQGLCGNIVWLKNPLNDEGQPLHDRRNPDASKRNRPICGLPVIGNLRMTSDGWDDGWIYSPEEGSQYDLAIQVTGPNKLTVTGYKGVKLFSKTFVWTRAPTSLQKCNGASQTKAPAGTPAKAVAPSAPAKPSAATAPPSSPKAAQNPPKATATPAAKPAAATAAKPGTAKPAAATAATKPAAATAAKPGATKPAAATAKPGGAKPNATATGEKQPAAKPKPAATKPATATSVKPATTAKKKTADEMDPSAVE